MGVKAQHAGAARSPPLRYARFVDAHPWLALLAVLILPVALSAVAFPFFELNDLDGWNVPTSDSSKAFDAWTEATLVSYPYVTQNATRRRQLTADLPRSRSPRTMTLYVEDLTTAQNMLRPEGLSFLARFESRLRVTSQWTEHCLLDEDSQCVPPRSVIDSLVPQSAVPAAVEASAFTDSDVRSIVDLVHTSPALDDCVTNGFFDDQAAPNTSFAVRSSWHFGLPIEGFATASENEVEQATTVDRRVIRAGLAKKAESIISADFADVACSVSCERDRHQFRVLFDYGGLSSGWATRQLAADGPLAGASMAFVLLVMALHTRSAAIAGVGMLQILLSFPVAFFFYRVVLQITHFGTLQVLAIYVILGIGADDIFVLYDAFQQAPRRHGAAYRLSWALRRAVSAMTVTSLTTFAAFVVTALSPVTNIRVFGIFASLLVLTNFVLCCLLTPVLITLVDSGECCLRCCCCCQRKVASLAAATDVDGRRHDRLIERTFRLRVAPLVIRFRWVLVVMGAALLGSFGYFALQLAPSDAGIGDIWPTSHPVAVVSALRAGPFLKGEARYMRVAIVFGLNDNTTRASGGAGIDRAGTNSLNPTDKGVLAWHAGFDLAAPAAQLAFVALCDAFDASVHDWVHDMDCVMKDLVRYRGYFGLTEFPLSSGVEFWGNLSAMLGSTSPLPHSAGEAASNVAAVLIADRVAAAVAAAAASGTPLTADEVTELEAAEAAELAHMLGLGPRHVRLSTIRLDRDLSIGSSEAPTITLAQLLLVMPHPWDVSVSIRDTERRQINALLDAHWESEGAAALGRGTVTAWSHTWMDTQMSLVSSSLLGLAVAFALAFVVLLAATRSLATTAISIVTIVGIVAVVLGTMVCAGGALGFMESICVTVVVGLAVDYVVHYGIAFVDHYRAGGGESAPNDAPVHAAVTGALADLGVSVVGGGFSTFGAALFLLMTVIKYLQQFGQFIAIVIAASLIFSSFIYPALLAALAPMQTEAHAMRWLRARCTGDKATSTEPSVMHTSSSAAEEMAKSSPL